MTFDNNSGSDSVYFGNKDSKQLIAALNSKATSFYKNPSTNRYLLMLRNMWEAYHNMNSDGQDGHSISFTGEQGEITDLRINHFRNLADHIINIVTSVRPTMDARAINSDYRSQTQTFLANGILDYYMREKGLEKQIHEATKMAVVLGTGYVRMEWNETSGDAYDVDPDTGEVIKEGEVEFSTVSPFDVVFDGSRSNWNPDWVLIRSAQNRYDLAAKYPEHAEKIIALPRMQKEMTNLTRALWSNDDTDDVYVAEFFHRRCESLPEGRYLMFLGEDIDLLDAPLPYRQLPIFRITPSDIMGTPYGYSPMFDVLPLQQAMNSIASGIYTNNSAFLVQSVWAASDSDVDINMLNGGMNFFTSKSKPEAIQLTSTPKESFDLLALLQQQSETIAGINSVTRGNPEASLKSGTALALVQSMSIQFQSTLQGSYVKLVENCGTALINILKDFAKRPKVAAIVGKNNQYLMQEFTGEKLSAINRVIVDVGNPLAKTLAGRTQMAEQMLQMGLIKNPSQYFQVIETGRLDQMYDADLKENFLIQDENEHLLDGKYVQAMAVDEHLNHIKGHRGIMSNVNIRSNPELSQMVMAHIQEHVDLLKTVDPALLQLIGEQSLAPPPMAPPMPGQGAPAPQGGPAPSQELQQPQPALTPEGSIQMAGGEEANLPNLPQVDPSLLPNPDLQQSVIGNVG